MKRNRKEDRFIPQRLCGGEEEDDREGGDSKQEGSRWKEGTAEEIADFFESFLRQKEGSKVGSMERRREDKIMKEVHGSNECECNGRKESVKNTK